MLAFMWAVVFPSIWRYSGWCGQVLPRPYSMSVTTSGSAFSLIVIPAVVCGQYTIQIPSVIPLSPTASRTFDVMSWKPSRAVCKVNLCTIAFFSLSVFQMSTLILFSSHIILQRFVEFVFLRLETRKSGGIPIRPSTGKPLCNNLSKVALPWVSQTEKKGFRAFLQKCLRQTSA